MRDYKVDVPVRVMIWTRPECQRRQFEVLREAAPSIMFLISDGGRNEKEKRLIAESRAIFDEIDWDCKVYKLYYEENQGMFGLTADRELIWSTVDRCIFLEDDYVPSVSFFAFCAELLEKYKDDERIEMICGHNVFVEYKDAEPYDYFFTEKGGSIWGTACWKRTFDDMHYPLKYENNTYIKKCLKDSLTSNRYKQVKAYTSGNNLYCNHVPGSEYFHTINSVLYHRLTIVPTKNMIKNIGMMGEHSHTKSKKLPSYFNGDTFEINHPIKHPEYVIDDKNFGKKYDRLFMNNNWGRFCHALNMPFRIIKSIFDGRFISAVKRRVKKPIEK